jgi:hypothetical protein
LEELAAVTFKVWVVVEENGVLKPCKRRLMLLRNVGNYSKTPVLCFCILHSPRFYAFLYRWGKMPIRTIPDFIPFLGGLHRKVSLEVCCI